MKFKKITPITLISFCFLISSLSVIAQGKFCAPPPTLDDVSKLEGNWAGEYTYLGTTYDLKINFKMDKEKLVASTALPEFEISSTKFKTWICPPHTMYNGIDSNSRNLALSPNDFHVLIGSE